MSSTMTSPRQPSTAPPWQQLAPAPQVPVRAAAVERLLRTAVARLDAPLAVELPDGRRLTSQAHGADAPAGTGARAAHVDVANDPVPTLRVHSERLFHRLGAAGKLGLGESYMAGEWDADDLPGVLTALAGATDVVPPGVWRAVRRLSAVAQVAQPNTLDGAQANIRHHYDLSNELFALFLDESMTYSGAAFEPGDSLEQAQARKRAKLLDALDLGPEQHLLEIGTGWGALAIDAARRTGCRVTTITLSHEQADHARALVARSGLADRIDVRVCDYRQLQGRFDAIVSVEMLEAVGQAWWPTYFERVARLLAPGGRAAVQTITMTHDAWLAARGGHGWIHRYIFPGGEIPSLPALQRPLGDAGLGVVGREDLGPSYVDTLAAWRHRFLGRLPEVRALGFDDTFVRMWEYYLAYCEAGFRTRRLGVSQLVLAADGRARD